MQPNIPPRLAALRQALDKEGLDALFVARETNVAYLSGYTNHEAYLFISGASYEAANVLITDSRYAEQAAGECPDYQVLLHKNNAPTLSGRLAELCARHGIKRLGFEPEHISFSRHAAIQKELAGVEFCPVTDLVEELRIVKDEAETELLRIACAGTDTVFAEACALIRPGITERELEWELLSGMRRHGFDASFDCIVVSGERGSLPHGVPGDKQLAMGEFITIDFGCMYKGYHADMTRTVFLGAPSAEQRRIYDIVLSANQQAAAAVHAGVEGAAVDAVARDYIAQMGYGENFSHGLGHGVGLDIHERPFLNKLCRETLRANSFVTVEPGIYVPGHCGVRVEDTVRVTEDGCEVLFNTTKELICL